jgi:hypothetical protein
MDNTFKFGLSDNLISSVREVMEVKMKGGCPKCGKSPCQCDGDPKVAKEELVGNQKKLDKNHNGKLDKQDFKMLRKEEAEAVEEEQIDELSNKTLYRYGAKAHDQVIKTGMGLTKKQGGLKTKGVSLEDGKRKMANRKAGVELAHKKAQAKTNEEVVSEGNPVNKEKKNAAVAAVGAKNKDDHYLDRMNPAVADKIRGREKMSGVDRKQYKEEVEFSEAEIAHINEILKDL